MITKKDLRNLHRQKEVADENLKSDKKTISVKISEIVEHIIDDQIKNAIKNDQTKLELVYATKPNQSVVSVFDNINVTHVIQSIKKSSTQTILSDLSVEKLAREIDLNEMIRASVENYAYTSDLTIVLDGQQGDDIPFLTFDLSKIEDNDDPFATI